MSALDEDLEADDDDDDEEEEEEEEEKVSLFLSPSLLTVQRECCSLPPPHPPFSSVQNSLLLPFSPPPSHSSHHLGVDPPVHRGKGRSPDTPVPADRHTEEVGADLRQRDEGGATHGLHGDIDTDLPLPEGGLAMQSKFS